MSVLATLMTRVQVASLGRWNVQEARNTCDILHIAFNILLYNYF